MARQYGDKYVYASYSSEGRYTEGGSTIYGPPNSPYLITKYKYISGDANPHPVYTITYTYTYSNNAISSCTIRKEYMNTEYAGARRNTYVEYKVTYSGNVFTVVSKETGTVS